MVTSELRSDEVLWRAKDINWMSPCPMQAIVASFDTSKLTVTHCSVNVPYTVVKTAILLLIFLRYGLVPMLWMVSMVVPRMMLLHSTKYLADW